MGRKVVLIGLGILALSAAGFALLSTAAAQDWLLRRAAPRLLAEDRTALFTDDALRVVLCGTSSPLADPTRAKSCTLVIAGGKYYLVDVGPESTENLMRWRIPMERVGAVFLTHFHSDHIGELGEFNLQSWAQGRPEKLAVYGPPGVAQVVAGFSQAYRLDQGYRTAHHGAALMRPDTWDLVAKVVTLDGPPSAAQDRTGLALQSGDLKVTAIEVNHSPVDPAYGYRFDYKGRSVVVSGDTRKHEPLARAALHADILVHEAQAKHMVEVMRTVTQSQGRARRYQIFTDIQSYHTSPSEAAELANAAQVKLLVLSHLTPPPSNFIMRAIFTRGLAAARHGAWDLGADGKLYELGLDGSDVRIGQLE